MPIYVRIVIEGVFGCGLGGGVWGWGFVDGVMMIFWGFVQYITYSIVLYW
jgi:hypothetical protein